MTFLTFWFEQKSTRKSLHPVKKFFSRKDRLEPRRNCRRRQALRLRRLPLDRRPLLTRTAAANRTAWMATPHRLSHPFHPSHKARTLSILFNTAVIQWNFSFFCVCVGIKTFYVVNGFFFSLDTFPPLHLKMRPRWDPCRKVSLPSMPNQQQYLPKQLPTPPVLSYLTSDGGVYVSLNNLTTLDTATHSISLCHVISIVNSHFELLTHKKKKKGKKIKRKKKETDPKDKKINNRTPSLS